MNSKILLLVACVLSFTFVSCNNDEPKDDVQTVAKVKNVECSMKANLYDLAEVAEITISYFDEAGAPKSEVVTTKTWEKKITSSIFPFKLTPKLVIKAKSGTPSKEKYDLGCVLQISYTVNHVDGKTGRSHSRTETSIITSIGYQATALDRFFERYGNKDIELGGWTLGLNSDGTAIVEE